MHENLLFKNMLFPDILVYVLHVYPQVKACLHIFCWGSFFNRIPKLAVVVYISSFASFLLTGIMES